MTTRDHTVLELPVPTRVTAPSLLRAQFGWWQQSVATPETRVVGLDQGSPCPGGRPREPRANLVKELRDLEAMDAAFDGARVTLSVAALAACRAEWSRTTMPRDQCRALFTHHECRACSAELRMPRYVVRTDALAQRPGGRSLQEAAR